MAYPYLLTVYQLYEIIIALYTFVLHTVSTTVLTISPTSSINIPVNSNVTVQAIPGVNLIAAVIPPLVVLILITAVAIPVITICLCRKRGDELQEQGVYYSEVGLSELSPFPLRDKTLKRDAEPQYWTITDINEKLRKPPILHSADDTNSQPRPKAEANHNHAVQEHTTCATAIMVPLQLMENRACGTDIAQRVSSRNEITTKPTHGAAIPTEDVETNANIAYSCNDDTFAVTGNPAYSTDIAIAPHVSTQENVAYSITLSQSVSDDDVANITGGHGDSYGGETATVMIPLTDIHPAHCTSAGIAPDILENSESLSTTHSTAITVPLTENQACGTGIAKRVSSRNEITTKPTHGADIATEDVETDAYSCNDVTFAVTDNPAYSTDIAIAPDVSAQENVAYSNTPSQSVCDDNVANITGGHGDSCGGETATMIPLTDIHPAHSASVAIAPENSITTCATAITLMENQAYMCRTDHDIAQQVSSRNENTTKPAHGADIATEDVETDANIAYNCNDDTFAVTDNPAYSTDIAIAPHVSTQENVAYSIKPSQSVCDDDVANITGGHGDSYGGETATMIPLTDIHPAHCTSVAIAPENSITTCATAITLMENQAYVCRTDHDIAQQVSSRNEITTKPTHGADIATEDVETDANIAYSCNDDTFTVTDNPAYSTDIAIDPDVNAQQNVAYNITPSQSVCDD